MTTRNELFGRLLKAGIGSIAYCEGKTAPAIERDLGQQIGVGGYAIQRYKAGHVPNEPHAVQILAVACVRRGYLNREWLRLFLDAARYPNPASLVDQLYPSQATRSQPPRVYENLPAPTYTQFVMRQQAYDNTLEGLRQRSPVVLIVSFGGMGKTSLAREIAVHCLKEGNDTPLFDAVVWVSDKDRPGTVNLSIVLNEIARTLDYPGVIQFAHDEKRYEVEQLLRQQKVLLVIDNFETITDRALADWLVRLPEPSKAIVTSREYRRDLPGSWPVDLQALTEAEACRVIDARSRLLKLDKLIHDPQQLTPLIELTGGNPKALELTLGLIKHRHQPLQHIIDDLYLARGELFDDLFMRAWSLLDEPAQHVLLALTLFPQSASHSAVSSTANVHGLIFDRAIAWLSNLALLDSQPVDLHNLPRYGLHPLVRAFARGKLAERASVEAELRRRWIGWYRQLAAQVGFCWNDLQRLDLLDREHETLHAALTWAFEQQHYADTIALIKGVRYYYNVRGLWDDRLAINLLRIDAARRLNDHVNEALALAHHVEIRSKQGMIDEATTYYRQLQDLAQVQLFPDDVRFEIQHAMALYARAGGDLPGAQQIWSRLLELTANLGGQKSVINRRWLATCRYEQGDLAGARQLYTESLRDAIMIDDQRSMVGNVLKLATIDLDQGDLASAETALESCRATAEYAQDRRRLGELHRIIARLQRMRGDDAASRDALLIAVDLFARLGMQRELAKTQKELQDLDVYLP